MKNGSVDINEFQNIINDVAGNGSGSSFKKDYDTNDLFDFDKPDLQLSSHKDLDLSFIFYILIVLAGIIILVFIYKKITNIRKTNSKKRKKSKKKKNPKKILDEKISKKTTYKSLYNKAELLENENKIREAVRMYYIALLFNLHDKEIIEIKKADTNSDIVKKLKNSEFIYLKEASLILDTYYETWYGYKTLDSEKLMLFKSSIKKTGGIKNAEKQ